MKKNKEIKEVYTVAVECTNCRNHKSNVGIPNGITVDDYINLNKCPVCGCKTLKRSDWITTTTSTKPLKNDDYWYYLCEKNFKEYKKNCCPNCGKHIKDGEIHPCWTYNPNNPPFTI